MSKASARDKLAARFASLSQADQARTIERNISEFRQHQEEQRQLFDKVQEIGGEIDLANLRLSEVDDHTAAMNHSIAELIIGLDVAATSIETEIEGLQSSTIGEKVIGMFSSRKANAMKETRIRSADIGDNLNSLLTKSNAITTLLQRQLEVIVSQKDTVETSLRTILEERQATLDEKAQVTAQLDTMVPNMQSLRDQVANEADPAMRAALQREFEAENLIYTEMKQREQELLSQSQTQEGHTETYRIYLNSLQAQESSQRILLNKIKEDTRHRSTQWAALLDSMKTAVMQNNGHKINDVGVAVDMKGRTVMAGIAIGSERRLGEMMDAHKQNMQQADFVQGERDRAAEQFEDLVGRLMSEHDAASYRDAAPGPQPRA